VLLLGNRFEIALATWASRVSGIENALWREEDAQGHDTYIALSSGQAEVATAETVQSAQTALSAVVGFAPELGTDLRYELAIGLTPLRVDVQAADDAAAAQARVSEAWTAGLWPEDGWTLEAQGGGLWKLTPPPALGLMPGLALGYGWTLESEELAPSLADVTHITHALTVTMVVRCPVRSRDLAVALAARLQAAIRSGSDLADRGAELGLTWGSRPTVSTPQFTLDAQGDIGGIIDAAVLDVVVYAHTVLTVGTPVLGAASLQIVPVPGPAAPTIELP
jgi:hypothetical protein